MLASFLLAALAPVCALAVIAVGATRVLSGPAGAGAAATAAAGPSSASARNRARDRVTIAWVGDTMLGHAPTLPPGDGSALFTKVRPSLRSADIAFANLEGTFSVNSGAKCGAGPSSTCFAFQAPPSYAASLRNAGLDIVNLANNHAFDFAQEGQRQTLAALAAQKLRHTGRPGEITVMTRNGIRVAFVGFAPYPWAGSMHDVASAQTTVKWAGRLADVVVVALHAGAEGGDKTHTPAGVEHAFGEDRGDTRGFAHAVVDAGADLVVGSGPHVIRGVERYRGRPIAYSLGNFAGFHNFGAGGVASLSGILRVTLRRDGSTAGGRWTSATLSASGTPSLDATHASARLAAQRSREDFGAGAMPMAPDGRLRTGR